LISTYTDQTASDFTDPDDSVLFQLTETETGSYSYTDDLLIQTDPLNNTTISGSDTGKGQASGVWNNSDHLGNTINESYTFTSGGNQAYSNNGASGAWQSGNETDTFVQNVPGQAPYTITDSFAPNNPSFVQLSEETPYTGPQQFRWTNLEIYPWPTWGETQPSPSAQGTPPNVSVQPDPYWSKFFGALWSTVGSAGSSIRGAIQNTVDFDANVTGFTVQTVGGALGFSPESVAECHRAPKTSHL